MQQLLHLLIVDRERRSVLATWHGTRWLLPVLSCDERARAEPLTIRWLAEQGLAGEVVGQWLGRMTPNADGIDWLAVINASTDLQTGPASPLRWTPIASLTPAASLLDYQQWAVAQATQEPGLPSVPGPFGRLTWLDDVTKWLAEVVGKPAVGPVIPYRISSHEVVLGISTGGGRVYFKGLEPDRSYETRITSALSRLAPESFARTLALETRPDCAVWWLADACPGVALARCLSADRANGVAAACAEVQRRVMAMGSGAGLELPELSLSTAAAWSVGLLQGSHLAQEAMAEGCAAIERACHDVGHADVPHSWIPLDLDPENVLLDAAGAVRFIDMDDSFEGPAALAVATLARRVRRLQVDRGCSSTTRDLLYRSYERAWPRSIAGCDWSRFEVVAAVLEAYLGWKRVVKHTERGDMHGALELARARIASRLARAVAES